MSELLEVEHLSVKIPTSRGEVQAVRDVSFSLKAGEVLAVAGESGCGKSVMCRSIVKLLPSYAQVQAERICVHGTDISGYRERELCRIRGDIIAMVSQEPMTSLNPTIPVGMQIAEAIRVHQPMAGRAARMEKALELMQILGIDRPLERSRQYPHHFSGGMRQRIVLAAALAAEPELLLADEPTTALDVTTQAKILDLLADLAKTRHMAVLFVTHDLGAAARIADRVAVMYAGKIVEIGTAEEIYKDPRHPYTWGLLQSLPLYSKGKEKLSVIPGMPPALLHPPKGDAFACRNVYALGIDYEQHSPMFPVSETHQAASWLLDQRAFGALRKIPVFAQTAILPKEQRPPAAKHETNRANETAKHEANRANETAKKNTGHKAKEHAKEILLDVRHLSVSFPLTKKESVRAVDDVSFQICKGEIFGLVGESGSGKSTVARCIMNLHQPQSGGIWYQGIKSSDPKDFQKHRRRLQRTRQMIFQDSNSSLNQRMNVCDLITEPMKIHKIKPKRGSLRAEAAYQMKHVGLNESDLDAYPSALSGGQRQRVAIARALAMEPALLVADEPISSLDVSMQAQIVNLFKHLQKEHGFSFLFIAHDLAMAEFLCDRIGVMYKGRLAECAPAAELFANPLHPYTKSLLAAIPVPDPKQERAKRGETVGEQSFSIDGEWIQAAAEHYVRI